MSRALKTVRRFGDIPLISVCGPRKTNALNRINSHRQTAKNVTVYCEKSNFYRQ